MLPSELTILAPSRWAKVWPDGAELFELHEQELGLVTARLPHRIDVGLAMKMEELGVLKIVSAHDRGLLFGYSFWFLSPNLLSQGKVTAVQGPFYVHPDYRHGGAGIRIWRAGMKMLRDAGADEIEAHAFDKSPSGLSKLYERSGGQKMAEVWRILL